MASAGPWSLDPDALVGYQRAEFVRASALRNWLIACQFAIAMPGAVSVVVDDGAALYFLAAGGIALLGVTTRAVPRFTLSWTNHEHPSFGI